MLELTTKDFGKPPGSGKPGVTVWWTVRKGQKRKIFCMGWGDLILVNPAVRMPEELTNTAMDGWGEQSQRLTWVPELSRILAHSGIPHPSIAPVEALERSLFPRLEVQRTGAHRVKKGYSLSRLLAGEATYYAALHSLRRAQRAQGLPRVDSVEWRLVSGEGIPMPVAASWKHGRLRAILSVVPKEQLG